MPDTADLTRRPASSGGRRGRTVLSTRGRCLLAAGVATAACSVPLDERDLLRVGAFAAVLPLLALLLALATRRTVRVQRTLSSPRLPVGAAARSRCRSRAGRRSARWSWSTPRRTPPGPQRHPASWCRPAPGGRPRRCTTACIRCGAACTGSAPRRVRHRSARVWPTSPARCRVRSGSWCCPGRSRCAGCRTRWGRATGRTARRGGLRPGSLGRPRAALPHGDELRRVHWRSTARHDELMVRLEERPWRGGHDRAARPARRSPPRTRARREPGMGRDVRGQRCAHLIDRASPSTSSPRTARPPSPPGPVRSDGVLDALATLRPSARTDLAGPALPGSGDVLAVLGSTAADELPALLARCPGQGHAVLLDVGSWGSGGPRSSARRVRRRRSRRRPPRCAARGGRSPSPPAATAPRTCGTSWCPARPRRRVCRDPGVALGAAGVDRRRAAARGFAGGGGRAGHGVVGVRGGRRRAGGRCRPASPPACEVLGPPTRSGAGGRAQLAALAVLVTALFTGSGVLGVLPGPAAAERAGRTRRGRRDPDPHRGGAGAGDLGDAAARHRRLRGDGGRGARDRRRRRGARRDRCAAARGVRRPRRARRRAAAGVDPRRGRSWFRAAAARPARSAGRPPGVAPGRERRRGRRGGGRRGSWRGRRGRRGRHRRPVPEHRWHGRRPRAARSG